MSETACLASIGSGGLVYACIEAGDTIEQVRKMASKVAHCPFIGEKQRISLAASAQEALVVSQFTLAASCKGKKLSFSRAATSSEAEPLYNVFIEELKKYLIVKEGKFQSKMEIFSVNEGPFTLIF